MDLKKYSQTMLTIFKDAIFNAEFNLKNNYIRLCIENKNTGLILHIARVLQEVYII